MQKNSEHFLFFRIADAARFKKALKEQVIVRITTASVVRLREFQVLRRKALGGEGLPPLAGLNLGFTFEGLKLKWANNTKFAPGKTRPPGHYPIIGQADDSGSRARKMESPCPIIPLATLDRN